MEPFSAIEPNLYIGARTCLKETELYEKLNVQMLINVSHQDLTEEEKEFIPMDRVHYKHFPLYEDYTLEDEKQVLKVWKDAAELIGKHQPEHGVLVFCYQGVNRSVCTVAHYLWQRDILGTMPSVLERIQKVRAVARPCKWYRLCWKFWI